MCAGPREGTEYNHNAKGVAELSDKMQFALVWRGVGPTIYYFSLARRWALEAIMHVAAQPRSSSATQPQSCKKKASPSTLVVSIEISQTRPYSSKIKMYGLGTRLAIQRKGGYSPAVCFSIVADFKSPPDFHFYFQAYPEQHKIK